MSDYSNYPTVLIGPAKDGRGFIATDGKNEASGPSRIEALRRLERIIGSVGKTGRPAKPVDGDEVVRMVRQGMTAPAIAACLGVTVQQLRDRISERPELAQAVARTRAETIDRLSATIFAAAMAGDLGCAKFYLTTFAGWSLQRGRPSKSQK